MSGIKNHTQVLTAWFVQGLFGDRGLENFYSFQQECIKPQLAKEYTAPQRHLPSTLMDKVLDSYQIICDSAEVTCGQAYQDRLQLYAYFFDQLTNLQRKFWQKGSAEQRALLRCADIRSASTKSESTCWLKPRLSLQQIFSEWFPGMTAQSRSTVDDAIWKGRQFRTMIALFGEGVLYSMDRHIEAE